MEAIATSLAVSIIVDVIKLICLIGLTVLVWLAVVYVYRALRSQGQQTDVASGVSTTTTHHG